MGGRPGTHCLRMRVIKTEYILRDVNRWAGSNLRRNIRSSCARACSSLVPRPSSRVEGLGTRLELIGRA